MSKNVFTFALLAAMFGSVLMSDFCERFVQSGKNPVFFRIKDPIVSIGGEFWEINEPKGDPTKDMALTFKSKESRENPVLKYFDDNRMAFIMRLEEGKPRQFVVIEKNKHKEKTRLVWSENIDSKSFPDFKPDGNKSINWFKGNQSLGMTDMSYGPHEESNRLTFLNTTQSGTIWTVVPKYYELNKEWIGLEKGKMSEDWDKKFKALKTNYEMIGVFFLWFNEFDKKEGNGLMMFFRDNKIIKWCWLSENRAVEECKNPKKELIDCSKTPDPPTTTTVSTTPVPESDDFPLVWILVAIGILVVIVIAIVVFIFCFLLTSKEDNENTTYNPSAVSAIETNRSSLKPKTSSAKPKT